jgi:redox-sensitive bicupin YhaK (pirin superfamily)
MELYASVLEDGRSVAHHLAPGRRAWLQVAAGQARLSDHFLDAGDGAAFSDEAMLDITANRQSEILLFDLA